MKSEQVIAPRNLAFGPNAARNVPSTQKRVITGDRLALKEDAVQYIRGNYQISDVKRVAGVWGGDRRGWTVSMCTAVLPILMPNAHQGSAVFSMSRWWRQTRLNLDYLRHRWYQTRTKANQRRGFRKESLGMIGFIGSEASG